MEEIDNILEECRIDIESFMDEWAREKLAALFEKKIQEALDKGYLKGFKAGCYTNIGFEWQPPIKQDFSEQ